MDSKNREVFPKRVSFAPEDVDILNGVLELVPELRICALAIKLAREHHVAYPIRSVKELAVLIGDAEVVIEGHRISRAQIDHYLSEELFPIADERQLAMRAYLGLQRCNEDRAWAARAPKNAKVVLDEYARSLEEAHRGG